VTRYDPDKHHRRSIRLKGYDYTQAGAYFVTIVTHGRELLFENPVLRRVAETMWQRIPQHFPRVELDEWVVMPNHIHGILWILNDDDDGVGARHSPKIELMTARPGVAERPGQMQDDLGNASPLPVGPPPGSLGAIVGNFKSVTARRINRIRKTPGVPVWQRNYYERVIRNERELHAIRQYICDNPARWDEDPENPNRIR
jgi:REP element-mobilizing transposase RayT